MRERRGAMDEALISAFGVEGVLDYVHLCDDVCGCGCGLAMVGCWGPEKPPADASEDRGSGI